jgi:hypothetical protein
MKTTVLAATLLLSTCSVTFCQTDTNDISGAKLRARQAVENVLVESYLLARSLDAEERIANLAWLSNVASEAVPSLGRLWAEEVFRDTKELTASWQRTSFQQAAIAHVARLDPNRALELLDASDPPVPLPNGALPEDIRANGARAAFVALWRKEGRSGLDQIRAAANRIGDTGAYPYSAIIPLFEELQKQNDRPAANTLFADALGYFRRGSSFTAEPRSFARFLRTIGDMIEPAPMRDALEVLVSRLTKSLRVKNSPASFAAHIETPRGRATFDNEADVLLFELLPLIHRVDPAWHKKLVAQRPVLEQADGGLAAWKYQESVNLSVHSSELQSDQMQEARLDAVTVLAEEQPEEALSLARSLRSPAIRAVGLSRVAEVLLTTDRDRAIELLREGQKSLPTVQEPRERLRLITALASGLAASGEREHIRSLIRSGFDLGEELFAQDLQLHPGKAAVSADGFSETTFLARLGARVDSDFTLSRIAIVRNATLKPMLLGYAAKGLLEGQRR